MITVPVGGSASAPQTFPIAMPPRRVVGIEIQIPSGNRGAVAFALGSGGTAVIPSNVGGYLSGDDEVIKWPVDGYIDSGAWQLLAYNAGVWPHTIQVRFLLQTLTSPSNGPTQLIPNSQLQGSVSV